MSSGAIKQAPVKAGRFVVELIAAAVIGVGVPLFWVWVGSAIQGSRGASAVEASTAVVIVAGMIVTYIGVMIVAAAIQSRGADEDDKPPPTRYPWNRSMRDEPYRPGTAKLTPVEAVFVGTATVATIAMLIWFFAFAGSPLPT